MKRTEIYKGYPTKVIEKDSFYYVVVSESGMYWTTKGESEYFDKQSAIRKSKLINSQY